MYGRGNQYDSYDDESDDEFENMPSGDEIRRQIQL